MSGKKGKQAARKGDRPQVGGALAVPAQRMEGDAADSSDEELDEDEIQAQRGKGPAAFRQRELVKEAFANDDVVAVRPSLSSLPLPLPLPLFLPTSS